MVSDIHLQQLKQNFFRKIFSAVKLCNEITACVMHYFICCFSDAFLTHHTGKLGQQNKIVGGI